MEWQKDVGQSDCVAWKHDETVGQAGCAQIGCALLLLSFVVFVDQTVVLLLGVLLFQWTVYSAIRRRMQGYV